MNFYQVPSCPSETMGCVLTVDSNAQSLDAATFLLQLLMLMVWVKLSSCSSLAGIRILPASLTTSTSEQFF